MTASLATVSLLGVCLADRWGAVHHDLRALAHGLERELAPLQQRPFPVPARKARLTRIGGRCTADGTPLTFDPWRPTQHVCPTCATVFEGLEHDDWWAMGAQLWSAERVLQSAMLGVMQQRDDLLALSLRGLEALTDAWPTYPNRDNALGPTRPFFSTYLESVWLLNMSMAAQLLAHWPSAHTAVHRFCDTVAEPSRALIRSFPEGRSNRQAWHVAARLAAGTLLGDTRDVTDAMTGVSGLMELLEHGLLPDGSWYEGENYHLFAHRGLWYGVMGAEAAGHPLPPALRARFDAGFATPLLGVLPDGTFPSRRDSRYGTSVHQWRFAEWCELGLARHEDPVVAAWLQRLYASAHARGDTGRARSTADIERDEPPCVLERAHLGWRTLLFARANAWPSRGDLEMPSVVLEAQGLTVLRRDAGRLYVALEGGHTGGGHGHPDRLALTLHDGTRRVLEDPGTGSYVERALHWYRSTLAHNAPLVNGRSQERVSTDLLAFAVHDDGGWMRAQALGIAPGVLVTRTVVLQEEHVVDVLHWRADEAITLALPMHGDADVEGERPLQWRRAHPNGAGGLEDGFDFLQQVECAALTTDETLRLARRDVAPTRAWVRVFGADVSTPELWRAMAPGPPRAAPRQVHWVQARGRAGAITTVWSLRGAVADVTFGSAAHPEQTRVQLRDGACVTHAPIERDDGTPAWQIVRSAGDVTRRVELTGARRPPRRPDPRDRELPSHAPIELPRCWQLGAAHYRGSEATWEQAGSPTASVTITHDPSGLCLEVEVRTGPVTVPPEGAENPLDNERADVNADGVQLYLGRVGEARWGAAWLLVPAPGTDHLRISSLTTGPDHGRCTGAWRETATGWHARIAIGTTLLRALADQDGTVLLDVLVNERPPEYVRRRGQLVLSGSEGEFVYLRGDRHEPSRAVRVRALGPVASTPTFPRPA